MIDALQIKDVAPALAWCADNKSRLKKSKVHTKFNSILQVGFSIPSFQNKLRLEITNTIEMVIQTFHITTSMSLCLWNALVVHLVILLIGV